MKSEFPATDIAMLGCMLAILDYFIAPTIACIALVVLVKVCFLGYLTYSYLDTQKIEYIQATVIFATLFAFTSQFLLQ